MTKRVTVIVSLLLFLGAQEIYAQTNDLSMLLTRAERTNYEETSRYQDVMAFIETVADASPKISHTSFGYTFEGRSLPLVVVGDVSDASASSVLATGKTRVFIQANIH
ncbi:MAG: peptidase M14, partial [Rhodothermales bacterium]